MSKTRILHLTDLHFAPDTTTGHFWNSDISLLDRKKPDRRPLLGALLEDLRRLKIKPSIVAVTGDLIDKGNPDAIPQVLEFLTELIRKLNLPPDRLAMVPGNHDEIRGKPPQERYSPYCEIRNRFYGASRPALTPTTPLHEWVELHSYPDIALTLLAFNSCEELDPGRSMEHGSVGEGQLAMAESLLASTPKGHRRIALMHHHLMHPAGAHKRDLSIMANAGTVRDWLAQHQISLVLHGHQHLDWDESIVSTDWRVAVTAGGSVGVGRYGREAWALPLSYQLITLNPHSASRQRREYDIGRQSWVAARDKDTRELFYGPLLPVKEPKGRRPSHSKNPGSAEWTDATRPTTETTPSTPVNVPVLMFSSEAEFEQATSELVASAKIGIDLCLHGIEHSSERARASALNAALLRARERSVPVRALAAPSQRYDGCIELSEVGVRVRLLSVLANTGMRYYIIDGSYVCIGVPTDERPTDYRVPYHNIALIKSSELAKVIQTHFSSLWFSAVALTPQESLLRQQNIRPTKVVTEEMLITLRTGAKKLTTPRRICIFYGPAASGKSTIMAQLAHRLPLRVLDLADIVIPFLEEMGILNVEASKTDEIYAALLTCLEKPGEYDLIEIAPDCHPKSVMTILSSIERQGRRPALVVLDATISTIRLRNATRARPIKEDVLRAQIEYQKQWNIEDISRLFEIPVLRLSTELNSAASITNTVEQWILSNP